MVEYSLTAEPRRVTTQGDIRWRGAMLFLSATLAGEYVALSERTDGEWTINFGPLVLGTYSEYLLAFQERLSWRPPTP